MVSIPTLERWRSRLPHWEVDGHWHFVTIRCQGSLPVEAKIKLQEIHQALESIDPQCDDFRLLQRRYFLMSEKYLDMGSGFAPFEHPRACKLCLDALEQMQAEGWLVGEATIMPNHIHLLILRHASEYSLKQILTRFKGRSSRWINKELARTGRAWQHDWFDRWMRHEGELDKVVAYIRNNPVKAQLVSKWDDYRWRISSQWDS